jgi:hypothetical protein
MHPWSHGTHPGGSLIRKLQHTKRFLLRSRHFLFVRLMTHGAVFADSARSSIASDGIRLMTHGAVVGKNHSVCHQPNVTVRERGKVGLRMRSKLEYLLFRSMWETYFCVHFQSRYGRLKPLQSFWYTAYYLLTKKHLRRAVLVAS